MREVFCFKRLKAAFGFFIACVVITVVFFGTEPGQDFFLESTLQSQYYEIEEFKKLFSSLDKKKIKYKEILYIKNRLEDLVEKRKDFILKDEAYLLIARTYQMLGEKSKALKIYSDLLENSSDAMAKVDSLIGILNFYLHFDVKKALKIAKKYEGMVKDYKKDEFFSLLARLYSLNNNLKDAGYVALNYLPLKEEKSIYEKIVELNWKKYTQEEKELILSNLISSKNFDLYAKLAKMYIRETKPSENIVEEIGINIINNCRSSDSYELIEEVKKNPLYFGVYQELKTYKSLSESDIPTHSAKVRGEYYYRKLRVFNRKGRYDYKKALLCYNDYLKGEIEIECAKKNLMILVRNLLAFKRYDDLIEAVKATEKALGLDSDSKFIADDVSFWTGYSYIILDDKTNAIKYFEKSIAAIPDGYYAFHAKNLIFEILNELSISKDKYINSLIEKYERGIDHKDRLFYARLLFSLDSNKDKWKKEVVSISRRYNSNVFFDFNEDFINRVKTDTLAYLKFKIYISSGLIEKAEQMLTELGVYNETIRSIMILKELLKYKNFLLARKYYDSLGETSFINENFAFFSKDLQMLLYPTPYDSEIEVALSRLKETSLDKYLVYAVIRGESMYIPKSRSRAGARGLMQLLPATARLINKRLDIGKNIDLYNPLDNIILGTAYLNDIIQSHGLLKGLAFYNGGPKPFSKIMKKFDPENELELLEIHPYRETRGYVKKILTNYLRYKYLYEKTDGIITLDIKENKKKFL
jgi:soluble lytic murein transglycosylase-like protein